MRDNRSDRIIQRNYIQKRRSIKQIVPRPAQRRQQPRRRLQPARRLPTLAPAIRALRENAMTMQRHETIRKPATPRDDPNLRDYDAARAAFDWADAEREIDWLPGGGLNLVT